MGIIKPISVHSDPILVASAMPTLSNPCLPITISPSPSSANSSLALSTLSGWEFQGLILTWRSVEHKYLFSCLLYCWLLDWSSIKLPTVSNSCLPVTISTSPSSANFFSGPVHTLWVRVKCVQNGGHALRETPLPHSKLLTPGRSQMCTESCWPWPCSERDPQAL